MRYKYIDSVRGIGCLIVLIAHIISTNGKIGMYAWGCGTVGVWLFMVMSGFLLIYRYFEDDTKCFEISDLLKFYTNKVFRLIPSYVLAIVLATAIGLLDISEWHSHLLLKYGWRHFWYMPIIIKFYLVAPLILLICSWLKKKRGGTVFFAVLVLVLVVGIVFSIIFPYMRYVSQSPSLTWYIPIFSMGIILAILMSKIRFSDKLANILIVIPVICVVVCTPLLRKLILGVEPSYYLSNKYLYVGGMWCLFIFFLGKSSVWKRLLENSKILQMIGYYSYDVYLIHFVVLIKMLELNVNNTFIIGMVTIIISFGIAIVVDRIKKSLGEIKQTWRKRA